MLGKAHPGLKMGRNLAVQVGEVGAWLLLPIIFLVAATLSSPLIFSASLQTLLDIFVSTDRHFFYQTQR